MTTKSQLPSLKEDKQHGSVVFPCAFYRADYRNPFPPPPFISKHHWQEETEILYFEQGAFQVEINMNTYHVDRECICFINSGELHYLACPENYLEQAFLFAPSVISFDSPDSAQKQIIDPILNKEMSFPTFVFSDHPAFPELSAAFKQIYRTFCPDQTLYLDQYTVTSTADQLRIKASLLTILACLKEHHLLNNAGPDTNHRIESLKKVMTFIKENHQDKIYIADLAELMNMNEQYFCRFFKKALGKTPVEYINDFRIRQAVLLLQDTELPVMDVCLECGFNNLGHFMKEFKKYTLLTPLQLRKRFSRPNPES